MMMRYALILCLMLCAVPPCSIAAGMSEDDAKASFLVALLGYVEWDNRPQASPSTLCLAAGNEVRESLLVVIESRRLGKKVAVRQLDTSRDVDGCDAVFIDARQAKGGGVVLKKAMERHLLTIGMGDQFIAQGGLVAIAFPGGRLSLSLNIKAAAAHGIKFSSRLISLARQVY